MDFVRLISRRQVVNKNRDNHHHMRQSFPQYLRLSWYQTMTHLYGLYQESLGSLIVQARALRMRYETSWQLADVEERIRLLRSATKVLQSSMNINDEPTIQDRQSETLHHTCLLELADALSDRYKHGAQIEDIDEQVVILRSIQANRLADTATLIHAKRALGSALRMRSRHKREKADLEEALAVHTTLVENLVIGAESHVTLYELGHTTLTRYEMSGEEDDLARCIALQIEALELIPPHTSLSDPAHFLPKWCLTSALWYRYNRGGDIMDLYRAVAMGHDVLRSQTENHRDVHFTYSSLGTCYGVLFEQTDNIDHLGQAVTYLRQALELQDPRSHRRLASFCNLATSLRLRYVRLGKLEDLEETIQLLRQGLAIPGAYFPPAVCELGVAYGNRYAALSAPEDLDESIRLLREALSHQSPGGSRQDFMMKHLGSMISVRYRHDKKITDLLETIDLYRETAAIRSHGSSDHGDAVFSLAEALSLHYEDFGDVEKLQEAIRLCKTWFDKNRGGEENLRGWFHHTFAKALALRNSHFGGPGDLQSAIDNYNMALEYRPSGHASRHDSLIELADVLRRQFEVSNNPKDIEMAKAHLNDALLSLPEGRSDRSTTYFSLARLHLSIQSPFFSVDLALQHAFRALSDRHQNPQTRLTRGLAMLNQLEHYTHLFDASHELRPALLRSYTQLVELLPRVAYFGLDVASRLRVLSSADKLAATGAGHALLLKQPELALEILEQGRAVFWQQHLRLRTTFQILPSELATDLARMAFVLDRDSQVVPTEEGHKLDNFHARAAQEIELAKRRQLSSDFEVLVSQARELPGFERFMLPDRFETLSMAAAGGPVVILLGNSVTCQAVVMERPGIVHQVELPKVTSQYLFIMEATMAVVLRGGRSKLQNRAMKKLSNKNTRRPEEVLEDLWRAVMQPVIGLLQLKPAEGRARPRMVLCPTGVFTHLPLHAAGIYRHTSARDSLSNYCVPSYTPTLGALVNARHRLNNLSTSSRVILAAVSRPSIEHWTKLPFAVSEVEAIKLVIPESTEVDIMADVDGIALNTVIAPTTDAMLERLPKASILHLACHGHQNAHSPLQSGFVLQDKMLTVAKLMSLNLENAFLAFLSACETAKGDRAQPDQALHLAATMLFVGFRSIIATMWSMNDADGPIVAETVYRSLYTLSAGSLDQDVVPYALDDAVRALRESGLSASRWASYVHLGA